MPTFKKDQGVPPSGMSSTTHESRPSAPPPGGDAGTESIKGRQHYETVQPEYDSTTKGAFWEKRGEPLLNEKMRADALDTKKMEGRSPEVLLKEINSMLTSMEQIIQEKNTRSQSIKETIDGIQSKSMALADNDRKTLGTVKKFESQCKNFADHFAKYESNMRELMNTPGTDTRELLAQIQRTHKTGDITFCAGEISLIFPRLMEEAKEQQQGYQPPKFR
jgi:hypothetical protein